MGLILRLALLIDLEEATRPAIEAVGTREVLIAFTILHAFAAWRFDSRLRALEIETARMLEIVRARLESD